MMNAVQGIVVPMVTPLLDEDRLDAVGLKNLVEYLIGGNVHGLFILGSTGEGPSLKHAMRVELIKSVCALVDGRIPVIVGITDASYGEAIYISDKSREYGAHAVALAPPYYYQIDQTELFNFVDQLLRDISLPVYLYNNPDLTKVSFDLNTVDKLINRPEVIGVKDSSGDMLYFQKLSKLTRKSGIPLLMGPEELFMGSMIMGGDGGVPGGANVFPKLYVALYESIKSGDLSKAHKLHAKIMEINEIVYDGSAYGSSSIINGIKYALKYLDICNDYMMKPLKKASPEKTKKIDQYLTNSRIYV